MLEQILPLRLVTAKGSTGLFFLSHRVKIKVEIYILDKLMTFSICIYYIRLYNITFYSRMTAESKM